MPHSVSEESLAVLTHLNYFYLLGQRQVLLALYLESQTRDVINIAKNLQSQIFISQANHDFFQAL